LSELRKKQKGVFYETPCICDCGRVEWVRVSVDTVRAAGVVSQNASGSSVASPRGGKGSRGRGSSTVDRLPTHQHHRNCQRINFITPAAAAAAAAEVIVRSLVTRSPAVARIADRTGCQ